MTKTQMFMIACWIAGVITGFFWREAFDVWVLIVKAVSPRLAMRMKIWYHVRRWQNSGAGSGGNGSDDDSPIPPLMAAHGSEARK